MGKSARRSAPTEHRSGPSIHERPLTARDVAQRCGVELKTVHNWVERGLLRHFRTPGRHLRFRSADVQEFLSRHVGVSSFEAPVLVIGTRMRRAAPSAWLSTQDAYEALCRAGAERPGVIVIDARGISGVDQGRYVRALRRSLPRARLFWIGASVPQGLGKQVELAANVEDVRRRILSTATRKKVSSLG